MIFRGRLEGSDYSFIPIADENGKKSHLRLFTGVKTAGYILRGGDILDWPISGITAVNGRFCLYGPPLEAESFEDILSRADEKAALSLLADTAAAYALLEAERKIPDRMYAEGLYRIAGGGLLVLSGELSEKLRAAPISSGGSFLGAMPSPPKLSGAAAISFSVGCAAYRILTGSPAFANDEETDFPPIPPRSLRPELREEVSSFVTDALRPAGGKRDQVYPTLAEWAARLRSWADGGYTRPISEAERREAEASARKLAAARGARIRRTRFLRGYGTRIAAAAVIAAALLALGLPILRNMLRPPVTAGMNPEAVVRLFYESMGRLDHETMEDCVWDGAGRGYIEEAMNLFVISRVRSAVEMRGGLRNADEWARSGRPPGEAVYGAAGLSVKEAAEKPSSGPVFLVSFERRIPSASAAGSEGLLVEEKVFTSRVKERWAISRIERLSEKPLTPPAAQ